jgi:mycofactocin biosynthetic radical S-adenosylmethionine protein MftC
VTGTPPLVDQLQAGLDAPICLTWELTYACNLACVHCLSSSGRRDPNELTTVEALDLVDQLAELQVFYVNIGGGEPMLRRDFFDIVEHSVDRRVGVKFSTNGSRLDAGSARRLAAMPHLDVQVSLDGMDPATNDAVRGEGSWAAARRAMDNLAAADFGEFKISVVCTRHNVPQLDAYKAMADDYGAQLRITRLRPSGRGVDSYRELRLTQGQQRDVFRWVLDHPDVLTGDSFFHLNALGTHTGESLPGLNLCGAGRIVCLVDPVGDVYACPFVIHEEFLAGNVRDDGGFAAVWRDSSLFEELRQPHSAGACASCGSFDACRGGCMASKFFTGVPLDGPDPDCVHGHADEALTVAGTAPRPTQDHGRPGATVPVALTRRRH